MQPAYSTMLMSVVLVSLISPGLGRHVRAVEDHAQSDVANDGKSAVKQGNSAGTSFLDKIIGGSDAEPGDIPWQASVKAFDLVGGLWKYRHMCGATIISEYWLLSAAHCFINTPRWKWQVAVGDIRLSEEDADEHVFEVENIYNHELYGKDKPFDYDVALIKIKPSFDGRGIKFSEMVNFTCILSYLPLPVNTTLLISGWGGLKKLPLNEAPLNPDVLQKAYVPLIDQSDCEAAFPYRITDRMFCAGYPERDTNAWKGDSGGPVVYTWEGTNVLYGIVSWTSTRPLPIKPVVYARVTELYDWIETTTSLHSDNVNQGGIPCMKG